MHNKIRNFVASGNHSLYNSAERMAFMKWDKSLAFVASFNVRSCEFQHDLCRNTSKFKERRANLLPLPFPKNLRLALSPVNNLSCFLFEVDQNLSMHKIIKICIILPEKFGYSGQNLGIRTISQRATSRKEIFKHFQVLINLWIDEGNLYCNQDYIDSFRPHPNPM